MKIYCFRIGNEPNMDEKPANDLRRSLAYIRPITLLLDMAGCSEALSNFFSIVDYGRLQELRIIYVGKPHSDDELSHLQTRNAEAPQLVQLDIDGLAFDSAYSFLGRLKADALQKLSISFPYPEAVTVPADMPREESNGATSFCLDSVKTLHCNTPMEGLADLRRLWRLTPNVVSLNLLIYAGYGTGSPILEMSHCLEPRDPVLPLPKLTSIEGSFYHDNSSSVDSDIRGTLQDLLRHRWENGASGLSLEELRCDKTDTQLTKVNFRCTNSIKDNIGINYLS